MTEVTSGFHPTPSNMVQEVRNIVEGYKMGALRALAQDPVQNSLDAKAPGIAAPVNVEYRLHRRDLGRRKTAFLLTISDNNTTGLRGPALSISDLERRAGQSGYLQLSPDENWAAWEAMGYTKLGEDDLGSRGQGKAAFLYHSRHDTGLHGAGGAPLERMIILYDSLLSDGTYRLGVRLAQPADLVFSPPYQGRAAKEIVQRSFRDWPGPEILLGLDPLESVGTRVIVPFLTQEVVQAFKDQSLMRWLERCWWRAIQLGAVEIHLTDENGKTKMVSVPPWWRSQPWLSTPPQENLYIKERVKLEAESALEIKRIVLTYDDRLLEDELEGSSQQYSGVQLLRHQQWIETLGASEKYADYIPRDKRKGFRGFVEFEGRLERQLRGAESPQHDTFYRTRTFVRQIDSHVGAAVREFATLQGWTDEPTQTVDGDRQAKAMLRRILDVLEVLPPGHGSEIAGALSWKSTVNLAFPGDTSRVEWGQVIKDISVDCSHSPPTGRHDVTMTLELQSPTGDVARIGNRTRKTEGGTATANFGTIKIVHSAHAKPETSCPEPGIYRLRAICRVDGETVTTATRTFFVRLDPPVRPPRPVSVGITVQNFTSQGKKVSYGDRLKIAITVTNRNVATLDCLLDASIGSLLFADGAEMRVDGRPAGDTPAAEMLVSREIVVVSALEENSESRWNVLLPPGRHAIRVDVRDLERNVIAHASAPIYVETDPEDSAIVPFEIKVREDPIAPFPGWELEPPIGAGSHWVLWYARHHPVYVAALESDRQRAVRIPLFGTKLFWAETLSAALVEWALALFRDRGDEGGFRLLGSSRASVDDVLWQRYQSKVEELISNSSDAVQAPQLQRDVVSFMLYVIRRDHE